MDEFNVAVGSLSFKSLSQRESVATCDAFVNPFDPFKHEAHL